jgi:hypothetical protein
VLNINFYYMAELVRDEKGEFWLVPYIVSGPNFAIRTAKRDRSRINFGKLLFQFIAQNEQMFVT